MKLLLDTCVWGGTKGELSSSGHNVIWGGDWETDPGDTPDEAVKNLREAIEEMIKEFGEGAAFQDVNPESEIQSSENNLYLVKTSFPINSVGSCVPRWLSGDIWMII